MAFMELQSEFGRWYLVETQDGTDVIPADVVGFICEPGSTIERDNEDVTAADWREVMSLLRSFYHDSPRFDVRSVECVEKWGARYSAPGYMDCTDWVLGDTQEEAEKDCKKMYGDDEEEEEEEEPEDEQDARQDARDRKRWKEIGSPLLGLPEDDGVWEDDEPTEDDYTTRDYRKFYQYGKLVIEISQEEYDANPDGWVKVVRDHMEEAQYWPNVWCQGERGDWNLLSLDTGGFANG
jgi:hypothetical protein